MAKQDRQGFADVFAMRKIGRAIKALDDFRVSVNYVGGKTNAKRIDAARRNLINVLFSNGYELQYGSYRVIKSKQKRDLI